MWPLLGAWMWRLRSGAIQMGRPTRKPRGDAAAQGGRRGGHTWDHWAEGVPPRTGAVSGVKF